MDNCPEGKHNTWAWNDQRAGSPGHAPRLILTGFILPPGSDAGVNHQAMSILKPLMAVGEGNALKRSLHRLEILHERTQPCRTAVFHF